LNGAFPLTLTRDRVEASELPFDRDLAGDVVRDFVAFCIAAAPEAPFVASGRKARLETISYPGFAQERRGRRDREMPYWIQTSAGVVLGDAFHVRAQNIGSIFLHSFYIGSDVPAWHDLVADVPQMPLRLSHESGSGYNRLRDALYGFEVSRFTGLSPIRFKGIRLLLAASSADISNRRGGLQARVRNKLVEEWRTPEWVIWRFGVCDGSPERFMQIGKQLTLKTASRDLVCAEKFVAETRHHDPAPAITTMWTELLGTRRIPYSWSERRRLLKKAFRELDDPIMRWRTYLKDREAEQNRKAIKKMPVIAQLPS
jgi:hypothetical protein